VTAASTSHRACKAPGPELEAAPGFENVDPLTAQVFHALGKVMHLNRLVLLRIIAPQGLQFPEVFALSLLSRHDGISQRDLAEILHLSHPRVSTILLTLETNGAVVRREDEIDRRLTRVFLTSEGQTQEKEQRAVLSDYVDRTIGALPEADRRELDRLLGELADRIVAMLHSEEGRKPDAGGAPIR
jgi:DNA-binding MarR family transcriptional regulator